jgi:hypothetical protein
MHARKPWRLLAPWLLVMGPLAVVGCLSCLHPVAPLPAEQAEPCHSLPKPCREHVHIFLLSGLDALNCGNLSGVRDYLNCLGFLNTYHGQLYHAPWFDHEIRRLHEKDADARFVLIGYGLGCPMVRAMARAVHSDGITIDLLVLLDGDGHTLELGEAPPNVGRVLNLQAVWLTGKGHALDGAENCDLPGVGHFGLPTHPQTLQLLALELGAVAASVPFVEAEPPTPSAAPDEEAPTPRPVTARPPGPPDAWDFLKPVSRLRPLPASSSEPVPATVPSSVERRAEEPRPPSVDRPRSDG